jgi:hypothetical protein
LDGAEPLGRPGVLDRITIILARSLGPKGSSMLLRLSAAATRPALFAASGAAVQSAGDRAFARYMIEDHRHGIAGFEKPADQRGPTAQRARQALPALRKHLAMAERLTRG